MDYDRNDALLHWIFRQTQGDTWFRPNEEIISSGVALRVNDTTQEYRIFPYETPSLEPFETAVAALNPLVAVKLRSAAVHAALAEVSADGDASIFVDSETRIQILDSILLLPQADREQCAAFIRDERTLIIWSESLDRIVPLCQDIEERLIKLLWRSRHYPHGYPPSSTAHGSISARVSEADHSSAEGMAAKSSNIHRPIASVVHSRSASLRLVNGVVKGPFGEQGRVLEDDLDFSKEKPSPQIKYKRNWYGKQVPVDTEYGFDNDDDGIHNDADNERINPRPVRLYAPLYNGIAAGLALIFVGNGFKIILMESRLDGSYLRFALLAALPILFCISLFFTLQIVQNITMSIGPIAHYYKNSKYYSAVKPKPSKSIDARLPHITIQMPVYKESLEAVLAPSIRSLKKAMQTYARQGGTSTILICDDGLRLFSRAERDERLAFYANHNIGWVARPRHDDDAEGGFKRRGRFKKASNMNYGLELSLKMEKHLETLLTLQKEDIRTSTSTSSSGGGTQQQQQQQQQQQMPLPFSKRKWSAEGTRYGIQYQNREGDESVVWGQAPAMHPPNGGGGGGGAGPSFPSPSSTPPTPNLDDSSTSTSSSLDLEEKALGLAIEETYVESGRRHRPWAANGRAIRIGEIVLLVDSDTVVPEDCLRDAAREMEKSPMVAIIQHESDVMQVAGHYFESGIAYFTRRINRCISLSCANGEVAPFMGHNSFLRWKAIQDAAFVDPMDGKRKIWSENNVSEDFDMALRLMLKGYIVRWANYSKGEFKEGVSLSIDDEINRWQKYSYGCNELLFNPLIQWLHKGPITRQIHTFLWSRAPLHYKISMMAYMFSYYGIAGSMTIALINYILLGFQFPVDGYFMHSFEIFLATTVVFWGSGTVGYTLLEYRLGQKRLLPALMENLIWIPFFFFFFGGLSIPISQAIFAHFLSYNITWSATVKEVQRSNFFKEIPKIIKRFWFPISFSILILCGMVVCAMRFVPVEWRVDGSAWAVILPLSIVAGCHILLPIVLNPWLMVFSY